MPRVDFYILSEANAGNRALLACRLAHKAYLQERRIYIHTSSAAETLVLDDLLWSFNAGSFVPHRVALTGSQDSGPLATPVLIGHDSDLDPTVQADVLVNLSESVPEFFERFDRVLEVVEPSEECRKPARRRFAHYRERGFTPESHRLTK